MSRASLSARYVEMPEWTKAIDWEKVRLEISRGVQMNILAREYAGYKISYVQFWRQFHKSYPELPMVTMRLERKPGEKSFFDYTEGIDIVDRATGEVRTPSLPLLARIAAACGAEFEFGFKFKRAV